MAAPGELHDLVERFDDNRASYMAASYNETELRINFLNPLFRLLGWDVDNAGGAPEATRRRPRGPHQGWRRHEGTRLPFRVGGERKFFLEAKKPSVPLDLDTAPAFQCAAMPGRRSCPSILNDRELAVYDCRYEPDRPATARVRFLRYDAYPDEWDTLAGTFSREAVLGGSLEKYAPSAGTARGRRSTRRSCARSSSGAKRLPATSCATPSPSAN
ncbi:MAG: hypothetical protein WKH64_19015 [Chloroflexia bacterium]